MVEKIPYLSLITILGIVCNIANVKASVPVPDKSMGISLFEQDVRSVLMKLTAVYYKDVGTGLISTIFDGQLGSFHTTFEVEIYKLLETYGKKMPQKSKDDIAVKLNLLREIYYQDVGNRVPTFVSCSDLGKQSLFRATVTEIKGLLKN